ncbi:MAG: phage gp6-like head-tail connector protein [Caulobacteraceae bacterium]|nr:phage gp6-like head-tail connector protein [Caulobacteraceae bacterium]
MTWWAGYGAAASVPQRVKNAILMTVLALYENRGDAQLPPGAKALLDSVSWGQYA